MSAPLAAFSSGPRSARGTIVNFTRVSQDVGVSAVTIQAYYEMLVDCLIAERVDPVTRWYVLFDLGVRRVAAREGTRPHPTRLGELFEQFVALELIRRCRTPATPGSTRS